MLDRRREVMNLWAKFIATEPPKGNVKALRGAA